MILRLIHPAARPAALSLLLCLLGCGGGKGAPSTPTTEPPAAAPPVTTPPAPVDYLSASCTRLGLSPESGNQKCARDAPTFLDDVSTAIDETVAQHPEYFNLNDQDGAGGYRVLSQGGLTLGIVQNLDKKGICGALYGEELAVKASNDFSDNFDIMNSKGYIRRGPASYRSYSLSLVCSREDKTLFLDAVMAAVDKVSKDHPEYFDFTDFQTGTTWYKVNDVDGYTKGVVSNLLAQGFCARWDGEEINVKNSNVKSENFDILTAQNYVRLGDGAYRVTCYPAYF